MSNGSLQRYAAAINSWAAGVTIVATDGSAGRGGLTVSAMCPAADDPATVLISLQRRSPINDLLLRNAVFCVSLLATHHDHVADTFAGRPWPGKERWDFTCGDWGRAPSGCPRLVDALAAFDCDLSETHEVGSHVLYLGRVTDVQIAHGAPLVYATRAYARPAPIEPSSFPEYPDARPELRLRRTS